VWPGLFDLGYNALNQRVKFPRCTSVRSGGLVGAHCVNDSTRRVKVARPSPMGSARRAGGITHPRLARPVWSRSSAVKRHSEDAVDSAPFETSCSSSPAPLMMRRGLEPPFLPTTAHLWCSWGGPTSPPSADPALGTLHPRSQGGYTRLGALRRGSLPARRMLVARGRQPRRTRLRLGVLPGHNALGSSRG